MTLVFTLAFPLLALLCSPLYGPLSLALVLLAAWRYGLLGACLAGSWAGIWGTVPAGIMLPQLLLPPLVVGCFAGYVIEKQPLIAPLPRLIFALLISALGLVLQLGLSGYGLAQVGTLALVCWWSWAIWSAGVFWVSSFLLPWREW